MVWYNFREEHTINPFVSFENHSLCVFNAICMDTLDFRHCSHDYHCSERYISESSKAAVCFEDNRAPNYPYLQDASE